MTPLFIDKNVMSRRLVNKGNKTFAILLNGLPMTTVLCFYDFSQIRNRETSCVVTL